MNDLPVFLFLHEKIPLIILAICICRGDSVGPSIPWSLPMYTRCAWTPWEGFGFILLCSTPCHASYLVLLLPSHVGHANNLCDHSQPHINFINSPNNDVSCKFIYQGHEVNYMKYTISGELIHFLRASTSIIRWRFQLLHLSKSLRKNIQLYTVCI